MLEHVAARLQSELGFAVTRCEPIEAWQAHNNRLWHLWASDGRQAVAKAYYPDDRFRLQREYSTLSFLRLRQGLGEVPVPWLCDEQAGWAVYSFAAGETRRGSELTLQHVQAIATFAARLHKLHPGNAAPDLRTSFAATFSLADQVRGIQSRLARVEESGGTLPVDPRKIRAQIEQLTTQALHGLSHDDINRKVPETEWSVTTGDFAPHNVLIDGERITVVDFEYSGWDDPLIMPADFLAAETSRGLAPRMEQAFLRTFLEETQLQQAERQRLKRVWAMMEVSWIGVHLSVMAPPNLAAKQFADPNLDVAKHIEHHSKILSQRLQTAHSRIERILAT